MDLSNFNLLKEDDEHYHVAHPNGKKLKIPKAGLSDKAHKMIQKFAGGGNVESPTDTSTETGGSSPGGASTGGLGSGLGGAGTGASGEGGSGKGMGGGGGGAAPDEPADFAEGGDVQKFAGEEGDPSASEVQPPNPSRENIEAAMHPQQSTSNSPVWDAVKDAGTYLMTPSGQEPQFTDHAPNAQNASAEPASVAPAPSTISAPAPMSNDPSMLGRQNSISSAMRAEQRANTAGANAIGGQGTAENQALQDAQDAIDQLPSQQDIVDANRQKNETLMKAYDDKQLDPNHYFHNMSTGSKIATGLGLFLGGMSTPYTHQANPAIDMLNNAINRDMEAQKNDQNKAHTLWSMNRDALGTDLAADTATRTQMLIGLQNKLGQAAASFKGPVAQANAQKLNAQLSQQIAMNDYKMSFLQGPTKEGQMDPNYPEKVVVNSGLFSPEMQKGALEEIKNARNITANGPKMLDAFDRGAKENTVLATGAGFLRTPGSIMELHQLMLPNFKAIDGTVRQAAMDESFHNITPQPGDTDAKIRIKRQALQEWMGSESAAPINSGHGNDLKRYPSTRGMPQESRMSPMQQQKVQIFMKQNPQVKDPNQAVSILQKAGKF